ncbi:hypothetical protein Forpe1208_v011582 [Fusarium oxysporum f. sp. rapae]|uniref:Uncharacterized protein n=1 Tax=Fusarium oxysporum f. sp. rapae TaxID=485398 RepID=A0A8J5NP83_FUSOX|nr:hypothetical protein Forpe1208_v011582 [Fusarium oxysporum f. sp. rapae]
MWDDSGRLRGLSLWMMQRTIVTLEKRCHSYGVVHDALTDAAWAIKELQKSYRLLQNLPSGSQLHVVEDRLPFIDLPRFRETNVSYVKAYSFGFVYISVRIQWLRILGVLSMKGLLAKVRIHTDILQELGEMAMLLPGALELSKHESPTSHHHGLMPEVLEVAFIVAESKHVLRGLVAKHPLWVLEVIAWIENMDTGIFTWSMGQDSPLCFRRAFQSFRDVGTTEEDMEVLESVLETSRQRVSELE